MSDSPARLVDLVHVFNFRGESVLTLEAQRKRIAELEAELAKAQSNCQILARRLKAIAGSGPSSS